MAPMQYFYEWLGSLNWGSVPDWFAASGTVAAVAVALYFAGKGAREQREHDKRLQAAQISMWRTVIGSSIREVTILNKSNGSIFDIAISVAEIGEASPGFQTGVENQVFLRSLPPGEYKIDAPNHPEGVAYEHTGIAITFRDAQGIYWRRDAFGRLYETETQEAYSGLNIILPVPKYERFGFTNNKN